MINKKSIVTTLVIFGLFISLFQVHSTEEVDAHHNCFMCELQYSSTTSLINNQIMISITFEPVYQNNTVILQEINQIRKTGRSPPV